MLSLQACWHCAQVAVLRVLHQLSEVYSVMKISSLAELIPFLSFSEVEQLVVEAVKHSYLQVCSAFTSSLRKLHFCIRRNKGNICLKVQQGGCVFAGQF